MNLYRCNKCGKEEIRILSKKSFRSYCGKTDQPAQFIRVQKPTMTDQELGFMYQKIANWFVYANTGLSSKAIVANLAFDGKKSNSPFAYEKELPIDHPHDPSDLNRCLVLLEWVPELRLLLPRMAKVSPQWKRLIEHWEQIEESFLDEVGLNWEKKIPARKTFDLMRSILHPKEPVR